MPRRLRRLTPYLLMLPGGLWLLLFFVLPMLIMASVSLQEGSLSQGYRVTWNFGIYAEVIGDWTTQFIRSIWYSGLVTLLTLAIGYPIAYFIAFRGGRSKNLLLLLVILPFFTAYIIRTLSWKMILADNGMVFGSLKDLGLLEPAFRVLATPTAVIGGLTYGFLPFMILPLYVALERLDPALLEASKDLGATKLVTFWSVTWPLSMPGVVAGMLLVFVPALGDFVTPELVGGLNTQVIGQNVYRQFLSFQNYPLGSALAFILMAISLVAAIVITRVLGREAS